MVRGDRALTLIEILVVVAIILVLAGLTLAAIPQIIRSAKISTTRARIQQITQGLQLYTAEHGFVALSRWGLYRGGTRGNLAMAGTLANDPTTLIAGGKPSVPGAGTLDTSDGGPFGGTSANPSLKLSNGSTINLRGGPAKPAGHYDSMDARHLYVLRSDGNGGYPVVRSLFNPLKTVELLALSGVMEVQDDPATAIDERNPGPMPVHDYAFVDRYPEQPASDTTEDTARLSPYLARYCLLRGSRWAWNDAWGNPLIVAYAMRPQQPWNDIAQRVLICVGSVGTIPAPTALDAVPIQTPDSIQCYRREMTDSFTSGYPSLVGYLGGMETWRTQWITPSEYARKLAEGSVVEALRRGWLTAAQATRAGEPLDPTATRSVIGLAPYGKEPFRNAGNAGQAWCVLGDLVVLEESRR